MKTLEAYQLARKLMKKHNLVAWDLEFDFAVRRFGFCSWKKRTISLSRKLVELNSVEQVTNTILHEIAHALSPLGSGHNQVWKKIALSIGDDGGRLYDNAKVITPPKKFIATCRNGHTSLRSKKGRISCGQCSPRFNKKFLFKYSVNPEFQTI